MRTDNQVLGVSIIICCHNSAKRLPETLQHLKPQQVPSEIPWEVIIVDNASDDQTTQTAIDLWKNFNGAPLRVVSEPKLGLSNARNRGLIESIGNLICFIDDDVWPDANWLLNLLDYALSSEIDAIVGKVVLPQDLRKPWMEQLHRTRLASTEKIDPKNPKELIGANMAIMRRVLRKVPMFDPILGSGGTGFGEESLFSMQLLEAGYKIGYAENAIVEHHFSEQRLLRNSWLISAKQRGKGKAYIAHHWDHQIIEKPFYFYCLNVYKLFMWYIKHKSEFQNIEGCPIAEMHFIEKISFYKNYMSFRKQKRNYEIHGLTRIN